MGGKTMPPLLKFKGSFERAKSKKEELDDLRGRGSKGLQGRAIIVDCLLRVPEGEIRKRKRLRYSRGGKLLSRGELHSFDLKFYTPRLRPPSKTDNFRPKPETGKKCRRALSPMVPALLRR